MADGVGQGTESDPADKVSVRVIGPDVFGLPKEKRKFADEDVMGLAMMLCNANVEVLLHDLGKERMMVGAIPLPDEVLKHVLLGGRMRCVGLLDDRSEGKNEIAGCVLLSEKSAGMLELSDAFVMPRLRGKGWGGRMLEAVLDAASLAHGNDSEVVELKVSVWNTRAKAFYERHGFSEKSTVLERRIGGKESGK